MIYTIIDSLCHFFAKSVFFRFSRFFVFFKIVFFLRLAQKDHAELLGCFVVHPSLLHPNTVVVAGPGINRLLVLLEVPRLRASQCVAALHNGEWHIVLLDSSIRDFSFILITIVEKTIKAAKRGVGPFSTLRPVCPVDVNYFYRR